MEEVAGGLRVQDGREAAKKVEEAQGQVALGQKQKLAKRRMQENWRTGVCVLWSAECGAVWVGAVGGECVLGQVKLQWAQVKGHTV